MNAVVKEVPAALTASYADDDGFIVLPAGQIELAAAKGDVRYYLNTPYLDLADPKRPMLVATNGHVLVAAPVTIEGKVSQGPIPIDAIKAARRVKTKKPQQPRLSFDGRMVGTGDVMFRRPDDVRFPDWRRVIPGVDTSEDPDIAFCGGYLDLMAKALGSAKYGGLKLYCSADDEGCVDPSKAITVRSIDHNGSEAVGVVMPMRW